FRVLRVKPTITPRAGEDLVIVHVHAIGRLIGDTILIGQIIAYCRVGVRQHAQVLVRVGDQFGEIIGEQPALPIVPRPLPDAVDRIRGAGAQKSMPDLARCAGGRKLGDVLANLVRALQPAQVAPKAVLVARFSLQRGVAGEEKTEELFLQRAILHAAGGTSTHSSARPSSSIGGANRSARGHGASARAAVAQSGRRGGPACRAGASAGRGACGRGAPGGGRSSGRSASAPNRACIGACRGWAAAGSGSADHFAARLGLGTAQGTHAYQSATNTQDPRATQGSKPTCTKTNHRLRTH